MTKPAGLVIGLGRLLNSVCKCTNAVQESAMRTVTPKEPNPDVIPRGHRCTVAPVCTDCGKNTVQGSAMATVTPNKPKSCTYGALQQWYNCYFNS